MGVPDFYSRLKAAFRENLFTTDAVPIHDGIVSIDGTNIMGRYGRSIRIKYLKSLDSRAVMDICHKVDQDKIVSMFYELMEDIENSFRSYGFEEVKWVFDKPKDWNNMNDDRRKEHECKGIKLNETRWKVVDNDRERYNKLDSEIKDMLSSGDINIKKIHQLKILKDAAFEEFCKHRADTAGSFKYQEKLIDMMIANNYDCTLTSEPAEKVCARLSNVIFSQDNDILAYGCKVHIRNYIQSNKTFEWCDVMKIWKRLTVNEDKVPKLMNIMSVCPNIRIDKAISSIDKDKYNGEYDLDVINHIDRD